MNLSEGSKQWIEAKINYPDEAQSAAETFFMDQAASAAAGVGAGTSSRKRREPPLSEEERREKKRIVQKKSRDKIKADVEKTKVDLKTTKKKVEDLEIEKKSLNEKIKSTEQRLKNAAAHIDQLKSLIEISNETNSSNQDYVWKLEKELQGLKIEYDKLERENVSLKLERDEMTRHLQASNAEEILPWEEIFGTSEQLQFEDIFPNEQNHVEQEQLGLEENGGLYFVGDGGPITTRVEGEIQELKSMLMTIMTQMDALKTSTLMAIEQISQRISAIETRNPPTQD